jgi:DNA-binding MarR family transcriptional regulator
VPLTNLAEELANAGSEPIGSSPGFMLWQLTNAWQRSIRASLAPTGLTFVQFVLLSGLDQRERAGESVSQAALAEELGTDAMMTSQVLRALEREKLVHRARSAEDSRVMLLRLTDQGRERLAAAAPVFGAAERAFFDTLGKKEGQFVKRMRKLLRPKKSASAD